MFEKGFDFEKFVFNWDKDKDKVLMQSRNISFLNIVMALKSGHLINTIESPTHNKQKCFLVDIDNYINVVPFGIKRNELFLKTIYPSRKHTKYFLIKKD